MTTPAPTAPLARLQSLDIFRGLTIAAMLLVNKQGNSRQGYEALQHVPWDGATPTDWIFPFFLFIVGVALPFSIANRQRKGASDGEIMRHALVRGAILFVLGMFEKNFPFTGMDLETFRIPGVLQRIAFCYVAATWLLLRTTARTQGLIAAVLLVGYWFLLTFVPVPGAGVVALTRENAAINWPAWIDQLTMGRHLGYGNHTWDANGLLSSFPAIVSTQFGILTAWLLRAGSDMRRALVRIATLGASSLVVGWLWGGLPPIHGLAIVGEPVLTGAAFFPINKLLWTSTYVLWTSGLAMLVLAACVWLLDLRPGTTTRQTPGWSRPFLWLGTNAIFVYMASTIAWKLLAFIRLDGGDGATQSLQAWLYRHVYAAAIPDPALASLLLSMTYLAIWVGIAAAMYARRMFVKL
jgi:predicted acyltransferase